MADQNYNLQAALWNKRSELALAIRSHTTELDIGEGNRECELIDLIQGMQRRDEAVTLLNSLRRTLADVDAAFIAMKEGWYGTCNECGLPIASKRLQAVPWALHCVQCQEELDHRNQTGSTIQYQDEAA